MHHADLFWLLYLCQGNLKNFLRLKTKFVEINYISRPWAHFKIQGLSQDYLFLHRYTLIARVNSLDPDQDLNCSLFESLGYFWPKYDQCRSRSDGADVMANLDLHWSHMHKLKDCVENLLTIYSKDLTFITGTSDQDLHCLLLYSLGYLWPWSKRYRPRPDDQDVQALIWI
jgi:hypothetical protein